MVDVKTGVVLLTRSNPPCAGCIVAKKILKEMAKKHSNFTFRVIDISEPVNGLPIVMTVPSLLVHGTPIISEGLRLSKQFITTALKNKGIIS